MTGLHLAHDFRRLVVHVPVQHRRVDERRRDAHGADALGMRPGAEANMRGALPSIAQVYHRWLELTAVPLVEAEALLAAHL